MNLKLPENLAAAAEEYAREFGYRNLQELAATSIREKIFAEGKYDDSFTDEEVELVDRLVEKSLDRKKVVGEEELFAKLEE